MMRIVCAFVCGAVLCAAQTGSPPSGEPGATPSPKVSGDEAVQTAPATPPVSAPAAPPAPAPAIVPPAAENALPPARKTPTEPNAEESGKVVSKYVIGPLDQLYVRVWNQGNLSGLVGVGPDGVMSMALIGELKADGLTVTQLKEAITARLNDFLNSPEVSVEVVKINSKSVLMIGGIGHPGKFPLTEKTTVLDAIVGSGGLRDLANGKKIYILRGGKKIMFNYKDVIQGKHTEQNIELQNGDQVVVPE
jgi:polysaccharide export outer membrane protein